MTRADTRKLYLHALAELEFERGLASGHRQPRYFTEGRPGIEETRGVPFAPKPKDKPKRGRR